MSRAIILSLASLSGDDQGHLALPAEIRSELGSVVERVVLSTKRPTTVLLPEDIASSSGSRRAGVGLSFVVVEIATRHGPNITRRIPFIGRFAQQTIDLVPDDIPEWLVWAAADINLGPDARVPFSQTSACRVWGRLWARRLGAWRPVALPIEADRSNAYAKQFELTTREPSVLQIGGTTLPSRFVTLPEGRNRVLLTANRAGPAQDDPLNVVVARASAGQRDTLLSALAMEWGEGVDRQGHGINDDPLSGCALGYAAMRSHAMDRFTLADAIMLFESSRGSSDAAILLATRELAEAAPDLPRIMRLLDVGIGRGLPVLAQSLSAASAALDTLRRSLDPLDQKLLAELIAKARDYSRARTGAGPFLSFYGAAPHRPDASGDIGAAVASKFGAIPTTALVDAECDIDS